VRARLRRYATDALIDLHQVRADRHELLAARHRHAARKLRADNLSPAQRLDLYLKVTEGAGFTVHPWQRAWFDRQWRP
jgi:hypothetical protein